MPAVDRSGDSVLAAWGLALGGGGPTCRRSCTGIRKVHAGSVSRLSNYARCARPAEMRPALLHNPNLPEDPLTVHPEEAGGGGDDTADVLRYLVATKAHSIT